MMDICQVRRIRVIPKSLLHPDGPKLIRQEVVSCDLTERRACSMALALNQPWGIGYSDSRYIVEPNGTPQ